MGAWAGGGGGHVIDPTHSLLTQAEGRKKSNASQTRAFFSLPMNDDDDDVCTGG